MTKLIIYSLCIFISGTAIAQMPVDTVRDVKVLTNKDTLLITRTHSDWYFGAIAGANTSLYFGDLTLSELPGLDDFFLNYNTGDGLGFQLGLMAEYAPPGKFWGYGVRMRVFDYQGGTAQTDPYEDVDDEFNYIYEIDPTLKIFSLSPYARYNMPLNGLHFMGGLDIDVFWEASYRQRKKFVNTGDIEQWDKQRDLPDVLPRVGVFAGAGYDFLMADINNQIRLLFSPYASIHLSSPILSNDKSTWFSFTGRIGLSIKMTFDNQSFETLPYDSSYIPPPVYIASGNTERGIDISIGRDAETPTVSNINYVDLSQVQAEADAASKDIEATPVATPTTEEPERKKNVINPSQKKYFFYRTSTTTSLSRSQREWLDDLAEYLKENPGYRLQIVGFSDNTGTLTQNTERSQKRAQNVYKYLVGKGISGRRLLANYKGSIDNIADNATEEGRSKNRRVEIVILR